MTDARIPERWLNDRRILRLPAEVFRSYMWALTWSVANRTDGVVSHDELSLIPQFQAHHAPALVEADLWDETGDGYVMTEFDSTQTSAAELAAAEAARAAKRTADRERMRQKRAKGRTPVARDIARESQTESVGTAVKTGVARESQTESLGQARTGQACLEGGDSEEVQDLEVDSEVGPEGENNFGSADPGTGELPGPGPAPATPTRAAFKRMFALLHECGLTGRDESLAVVGRVVGRDIESRDDLTTAEVAEVTGYLVRELAS